MVDHPFLVKTKCYLQRPRSLQDSVKLASLQFICIMGGDVFLSVVGNVTRAFTFCLAQTLGVLIVPDIWVSNLCKLPWLLARHEIAVEHC